MITPINSLANMEMMLYGGTLGANSNCPSFVNGYRAGVNNIGNYGVNYGGYSPVFMGNYGRYNNATDSIWSNTPQTDTFTPASRTNQQVGFGASQADLDILSKYYVKGMAPSESLTGAAIGGAAFGVMMKPRLVAHPWNAISSIKETEKVFEGVKKEGSELHKLWRGNDTHKIMADAYANMHRLESATKSKYNLWRQRIDLKNTEHNKIYEQLKKEMGIALKNAKAGDEKSIKCLAEVTEKIKRVTSAKTGRIPRGWSSLMGNGEKSVEAVYKNMTHNPEAIKSVQEAAKKNITEKSGKTIGSHLKHGFKGQAGLGGAIFAAMEFAFDWDNLKAAFEKDGETGMKQLGQTTVKAAGSIIGWTAGEAVGAWAGAKLGAALGTMIAPGVGTAIGAIAGIVGGSIGCALMGKITHWLTGESVGAKAKAEKMTKTAQGQVELLQLTAMQAQGDKKLDPKVAQALQNVAVATGVA